MKIDIRSLWREKPRDAVITLPNIITATGIITLVPYAFGVIYGWRWLILAGILWAGVSDLLDGILARRLKQQTKIGEALDPLRDRLLLAAILLNVFYLADTAGLWYWLGLIVLCECFIAFVNGVLLPRAKVKVHIMGKLRQVVHLFVIGLIILSSYFEDIIFGFFGIAFVFPLSVALPIMTVASFLALIFYIKPVVQP